MHATQTDGRGQQYPDPRNQSLSRRIYHLSPPRTRYAQSVERTTIPESIRHEACELEKGLERQPPKVREINRKRVEILNQRVEKYEKVRENCQVIDATCAAVEDFVQLIRDRSVTMRDPQQLSDRLDSLVHGVKQTEETVRKVEAIFESTPLLTGGGFDAPPSTRNRIRS